MHERFDAFAVCDNGRYIFIDPSDLRGEAIRSRGGCVHPIARAAWSELLQGAQWDCVVDVGANYGEMLIDVDLPESALVVAVEPNLRVLPYLRASLQHGGITAEVWPVAISAEEGESVLEVDRTWSGNSALVSGELRRPSGHELHTVPVTTITICALLTSLELSEPATALLKVDVEGHEIAVLRGLLTCEERLSEWAALVEVVRMDSAQLDWVVERFTVRVFEYAGARLVDAAVSCGMELRALLESGQYYTRDVVLGPRKYQLLDGREPKVAAECVAFVAGVH